MMSAVWAMIGTFQTRLMLTLGMVDFEETNVSCRTFFVPGAAGFGDTSCFGRLFPYYQGIFNIDTVDVGPLSSNLERARRLQAHIRHVYPEWSATNRIHLVGHSMGCNTILEMSGLPGVDPSSIAGLVFISPLVLGVGGTHAFGRGQRVRPLFRGIRLLLEICEYVVPLCVRRRLLHTLLPPPKLWLEGRVENTIFPDLDERACDALYRRLLPVIVTKYKIPLKVIATTATRKIGSAYVLAAKFGAQPLMRLCAYFLGGDTDHGVGYSLMREDVSDYTLRPGHHDGVIHLQTQLGCLPEFVDVETIDATHLSSIAYVPFGCYYNRQSVQRTIRLLLTFLVENDHCRLRRADASCHSPDSLTTQ